jgi:hypothetical protein
LPALGFYVGARYYLAVSHKYLDQTLQNYALYSELGIFYLAALMELRSRWSPAEE